jgi:hypothetical protein
MEKYDGDNYSNKMRWKVEHPLRLLESVAFNDIFRLVIEYVRIDNIEKQETNALTHFVFWFVL